MMGFSEARRGDERRAQSLERLRKIRFLEVFNSLVSAQYCLCMLVGRCGSFSGPLELEGGSFEVPVSSQHHSQRLTGNLVVGIQRYGLSQLADRILRSSFGKGGPIFHPELHILWT